MKVTNQLVLKALGLRPNRSCAMVDVPLRSWAKIVWARITGKLPPK